MIAKALSQEELQSSRQHLQSLAERLSGGVAQFAAEATRSTGVEGADAEAPEGEPMGASSEGDEEVVRAVLLSEEELLTEVRAALARCDSGTFGHCGHCGLSIGNTRLKAVPYARNCIRCARAAEVSVPN